MLHGSRALIVAREICKRYEQSRWFSQHRFVTKALDHVSLTIKQGSRLALVGESGSGKSTLARCLALLEKPNEGQLWFEGRNVLTLSARQLRRARRQIQLIFQDPSTALNPRLGAAQIVAEPLIIERPGMVREAHEQALHLMEEVGISSQCANRLPLDFSGGQRQRLALARALAAEPTVVILDEVFSGLDLPLQAQIAKLLERLQVRWGLTYLLISHDLALVCHMADEIAVLYRGQLVEQGSTRSVVSAPEHPHARALVSAALSFEPRLISD